MRPIPLIVAGFIGLTALPGLAQTARDSTAPADTYHLDPLESHLLLRVSHLGFSSSMAIFTRLNATLQCDPMKPDAMTLEATVDARSVETNYQDPKTDFNAALTGPCSADVTGDLTLHGVTKPVTMRVTFNGGYAPNDMDPGARASGFRRPAARCGRISASRWACQIPARPLASVTRSISSLKPNF